MMIAVDEPSEAEETPGSGAGKNRLPGYALAWREAVEIADAYRVRLRAAVLDEIDAGVTVTEVADLTGLSRVTLHHWLRAHRRANKA